MTNNEINKITLKPLFHRGKQRIGIYCDRNNEHLNLIRSLPNRKYSNTHKCWYIPYEGDSYESFKNLNIPFEIYNKNVNKSGTTAALSVKRENTTIEPQVRPPSVPVDKHNHTSTTDISFDTKTDFYKLHFNKKRFVLEIDYNADLVKKIKKLSGSYWDNSLKKWIVPSNVKNHELLQSLFSCWTEEQYTRIESYLKIIEFPQKIELYQLPNDKKRIALQLTGYGVDISFLKSLTQRQYDKRYKRWLIPYDDVLIKRVLEYYREGGVTKIINRLPRYNPSVDAKELSNSERQEFILSKYKPKHREVLKELTDKLIQLRYSWSTVRFYCNPIVHFNNFLGEKDVSEGNIEEVNAYLSSVSAKKVSDSKVHQEVNALKFYFEKVKFWPKMKLDYIKRPKKLITLPRILSKAEVVRILKHTENVKHKTVLLTIYASGLRISEVLSLRLRDIRWDRNQIFIHKAKGKKDRVVMLSEVLKNVLYDYWNEYKPVEYLFEGQRGGKYSSSSVQKVVREAAKKAKISQRVTPHTLRHCFATHLHDSGTSIKLIQELLGHRDIKTTLVYTHVSTSNVTSLKSPLDSLDFE